MSRRWIVIASFGPSVALAAPLPPPDLASVHPVTVPGFGRLTETRTKGRVSYTDASGATVADERIGPNEDHDLVRAVVADGKGLRRWQEAPTIGRCDASPPLFLAHLDAAKKAWVSDALAVPTAPDLGAKGAQALPPMRRALRFSAASSDGHSESADLLGAPRELDDGSDATSFAFGMPSRGAFVTARAPREVELTAIHVTSSAPPAALIVVGGSPAKPRYRLRLATGTSWFVLPEALRGSCVSFVVDAPVDAPVSIAEIGLHAADDAPDGLDRLAQAIAHDGDDSEGAAHSLEADPGGATAALRAMPAASSGGRRRLLSVVAAHKGPLFADDVKQLVAFVSIAATDERRVVVATLARQGAGVVQPLLSILSDPSQTAEARIDVVRILGSVVVLGQDKDALAFLFEALHDDSIAIETERVLVGAAAKHDEVGKLAQARLSTPDTIYLSRLVAIIAAGHDGHALDALGSPLDLPFPLAARLLDARGRLRAPSLYAHVGRVLHDSKDRTLRRVSVTALPPATEPAARMLYESAARDADALVRERALSRLTDAHVSSDDVLRTAANDTWPQLRRLAYDKLSCGASSLFRVRVFDKKTADVDPTARASALAAYARCPDASPDQIAKAVAHHQPAEVREAAANVLAEADPSVMPLVTKTLDGVFSRNDGELPDTAVALLRALGHLGQRRPADPFDDKTLTLLRDAASDPFYPTVRMAALEALSRGCPAGTSHVLDRAAKDPEPAVVRATELARQRCSK